MSMSFDHRGIALGVLLLGGWVAMWGGAMSAQEPAKPAICRAAQLEPFTEDAECGMGRCSTALELRNVGVTACTLPQKARVRALDARGAVMRVFSAGEGPLVLAPGEFGEYLSESYSPSADMYPHPPGMADRFVFRFSAQDAGVVVFPGNQAIGGGPGTVFNEAFPAPDLSAVPSQKQGEFAFSAFPWPEFAGQAKGMQMGLQEGVGVHVSVANHGAAGSSGWDKCRVVFDAAEAGGSGAHVSRSVPCDWNGDIARGAIAAGATVAMESGGQLPKICHASRFTVVVGIENAPVRFEPITLNTSEVQPRCDGKEAETTASPVAPLPPLATYTVSGTGVSFQYPSGWQRKQADSYMQPFITEIWGDIKPTAAVAFSPKGNIYQNTNLQGLDFLYFARSTASAEACRKTIGGTSDTAKPPKNVTIHGVTYTETSDGDGGAGNSVECTLYATWRGGTCHIFEEDFFTGTPDDIDAHSLSPAQVRALQCQLDAIMQTVRFDAAGG
jgi:hypothetical protein